MNYVLYDELRCTMVQLGQLTEIKDLRQVWPMKDGVSLFVYDRNGLTPVKNQKNRDHHVCDSPDCGWFIIYP